MGIKNCEISLDSPTDTYYAGQILNGNLKITFDKPKTVQALIIRFKGEAQTKWQETVRTRDKDGNMRNKTHTQLGEEEYFKTKVYLVGGPGSEVELAAGTYDFAFSWQIPLTVPSSFEGEHGYIRYSIKVTLDRPLCLDKEMHSPFTVITPVDLNMTPQLYTPATLDMHKSFCCLWCKSGPVTVLVRIPVTGYAPGQAIPISCECENASDVDVAKVQFSLRRIVTFTTTTPHYSMKTSSSTIAELGVGPVLRFQNKSYEEQLQIPVFPTTNLLYCGLMTMSFVLQVECRVSGCHSNFFNEIPITLGTIPLASFVPPALAVESPPTYESTLDVNAPLPPPSMDVPIGWNFGNAPQLGNEDQDYDPTQALVDENYRPSPASFQNPPSAPGLEK